MRTSFTLPTLLVLILMSSPPVSATPPNLPACTPAMLSSMTIREEPPGFSIDAEYPVLCQSRATRTVRDWVTNCIFDLKKLDPGHEQTYFPHKYELQIRYALWPTPQQRYLSVKLAVFVYSGGAHPNNWPMTWVFDLTDGHALELDELFPDLDAALQYITPLCRKALEDSLAETVQPNMLRAGTEPFFENYDRFILNKEGVTFFFPPYQVAPYAAGEQVVTIPIALIQQYLSSKIHQEFNLP